MTNARSAAAALVLLASCGDLAVTPPPTVPEQPSMNVVSFVTLCCDATLYAGATTQYTVTVYPVSGNPYATQYVSWSSSNPAVASVNAFGVVQANSPGSTALAATVDGKSASVVIQVVAAPVVTTVQVTPSSATLEVGTTQPLTARAYSQYNTQMSGTATWSTGNSAVATVSSSGVVSGVGAGTTSITATIAGKTASVPVTVQTPFRVSISGPSGIHGAGAYDWTATATGATGGYTYKWSIDWGGSSLSDHGTGDTASLYVSEYDPTYFVLHVEATSGTRTVTRSIGVCNFIASALC